MESNYENKLILFECENYIRDKELKKAEEKLLDTYRIYPGEIDFVHLLISAYILNNKTRELIEFLRKEEGVSLFGAKLNYIKNFVVHSEKLNLFALGKSLQLRGWTEDSNLYFRLHSNLNPQDDKSVIPLAEEELRSGNLQKGVTLFKVAADNYFNKTNRGDY